MLRDMNRRSVLTLPKSAPISFIRERWARHVLRGGGIDRRYYELCVLSELRNRLRAGDVWVVGSRRYRAFEERLISHETLKELERAGTLPIAVDADFERFIAARRALLNERLAATDVKAKGGLLPDVMLDKGVLKITPIEKSTPPEAEALMIRRFHQSGGKCGHGSGQCLLLAGVCLVAAVEGSIQQLRVGGKQVPIKATGDFLNVRADDWQCRLDDGSRLVRQHGRSSVRCIVNAGKYSGLGPPLWTSAT